MVMGRESVQRLDFNEIIQKSDDMTILCQIIAFLFAILITYFPVLYLVRHNALHQLLSQSFRLAF